MERYKKKFEEADSNFEELGELIKINEKKIKYVSIYSDSKRRIAMLIHNMNVNAISDAIDFSSSGISLTLEKYDFSHFEVDKNLIRIFCKHYSFNVGIK